MSWSDLQAKIGATIQAGGLDITELMVYWNYLYKDQLVDLTDLAEEVGKAGGGFEPYVINSGPLEGRYYGVPTGTSLGIERIIDAMDELDMFPPGIRSSVADVLVTIFDPSTQGESLRLATELRKTRVNTTLYYDPQARLGDQIGYASATGIPFVIILGPDEISQGEATIRRLGDSPETSVQLTVSLEEVADTLLNW